MRSPDFWPQREPALVATPEKATFVHCLLFLNHMANNGLTIATINQEMGVPAASLDPYIERPRSGDQVPSRDCRHAT